MLTGAVPLKKLNTGKAADAGTFSFSAVHMEPEDRVLGTTRAQEEVVKKLMSRKVIAR